MAYFIWNYVRCVFLDICLGKCSKYSHLLNLQNSCFWIRKNQDIFYISVFVKEHVQAQCGIQCLVNTEVLLGFTIWDNNLNQTTEHREAKGSHRGTWWSEREQNMNSASYCASNWNCVPDQGSQVTMMYQVQSCWKGCLYYQHWQFWEIHQEML